jgi:hypothetical protein
MQCAEYGSGIASVSVTQSIRRSIHKGFTDFFFASSRQVISLHLRAVIIRFGLVAPGLTVEYLALTL